MPCVNGSHKFLGVQYAAPAQQPLPASFPKTPASMNRQSQPPSGPSRLLNFPQQQAPGNWGYGAAAPGYSEQSSGGMPTPHQHPSFQQQQQQMQSAQNQAQVRGGAPYHEQAMGAGLTMPYPHQQLPQSTYPSSSAQGPQPFQNSQNPLVHGGTVKEKAPSYPYHHAQQQQQYIQAKYASQQAENQASGAGMILTNCLWGQLCIAISFSTSIISHARSTVPATATATGKRWYACSGNESGKEHGRRSSCCEFDPLRRVSSAWWLSHSAAISTTTAANEAGVYRARTTAC